MFVSIHKRQRNSSMILNKNFTTRFTLVRTEDYSMRSIFHIKESNNMPDATLYAHLLFKTTLTIRSYLKLK